MWPWGSKVFAIALHNYIGMYEAMKEKIYQPHLTGLSGESSED